MASLDPEQSELLITLCEAARRQTKGSKESFLAIRYIGGQVIHHPQLPGGKLEDFHWPDVEILSSFGLIHGRHESGAISFDVSPAGFEHYERVKAAQGASVARLETTVRHLLDSSWFAAQFRSAEAHWRKAEGLYWTDRSGENATAIGHHCREAMQFFGARFASMCGVDPMPVARTIGNVRAGLDALGDRLPPGRRKLLDALLTYWGETVDFTQRQEHGAAKEGEALRHEDSRMVVFHTALVMFELASLVGSTWPPNAA